MTQPEATPELPVPPRTPAPRPAPRVLPAGIRLALRWAAGVALVFVVGVGLTLYVRVLPLQREVRDLRSRIAQTEQEATGLKAEVGRLRQVDVENQRLTAAYDRAEQQIALLHALSEVRAGQVAMAAVPRGDPVAAKAALAATDGRLSTLAQQPTGADAATITSLRDRLGLVLEELDHDAFAARNDLEVLATGLAALVE